MGIDREQFFNEARAHTPAIVGEHDGLSVLVHTGDPWVSRLTFVHGQFELGAMTALIDRADSHLGRPVVRGRRMVDVGANIGTTTLLAIHQFGASHVIAIEPHPLNTRMIRANVALNGFEGSVTVIEAAVSDRRGVAELDLADENQGDHQIVGVGDSRRAPRADHPGNFIPVRADRLDHLVRRGDVGMVWVDTQGHDARVVASGPRLARRSDACVIEYWPAGIREGVAAFHAAISAAWPLFVDVADILEGDGMLRGTERMAELDERYPPDGSHTDVLLLK
jgi:FkbM family methyltransferase